MLASSFHSIPRLVHQRASASDTNMKTEPNMSINSPKLTGTNNNSPLAPWNNHNNKGHLHLHDLVQQNLHQNNECSG